MVKDVIKMKVVELRKELQARFVKHFFFTWYLAGRCSHHLVCCCFRDLDTKGKKAELVEVLNKVYVVIQQILAATVVACFYRGCKRRLLPKPNRNGKVFQRINSI